MSAVSTRLVVGIGDIHGRFARVAEWLERLQEARGRAIDAAFAVGDVEAFVDPEDHRRKAVKRGMPAEFADFASGKRRFPCPLHFIAGNNEDFATLDRMRHGGELAPGVHYLGRSGTARIAGLNVAFLSGIFAPKWFEAPIEPPGTTVQSWKQAGYFRHYDLAALDDAEDVDLLLLHEWARGLSPRGYMGNAVARTLLQALRPTWALFGHSHQAHGFWRTSPDGRATRVACLDQAAVPDGAVLWLEWEGGTAVRGGWGLTGVPERQGADGGFPVRALPRTEPALSVPSPLPDVRGIR